MSRKKDCAPGSYDGFFSKYTQSVRRKAIVLCCSDSGPRLTFKEAAKVLKVSPAYVRKWVKYYETTGLFGYLDKRQSAILIICKKNPGIPLSQVKILMQNMGFDLTYSKLKRLLYNLKPILKNPSFTLGSEDEVLRCIKKLTVFQNSKFIRSNFTQESGYREHAYAKAPLKHSVIQDHNYAIKSDSCSSDEDEEMFYDNAEFDSEVGIKTDFIDKAYALSTLHDNLSLRSTINRLNNNSEKLSFKLALLREQLFYACLDIKGPKASLEDILIKLYKSEVLINKLLNQAKSITNFVSKIHINKCCGRIQETIIRLYKLNPGISVGQVKCILEKVNIYLTPLQVKRYIDTLQYILKKPVNTENDLEDILSNEIEVDYCINILNSIILPKEKRKSNINSEYPKLTFEKIIELSSVQKAKINSLQVGEEKKLIETNKEEKIVDNKEEDVKTIQNSEISKLNQYSSPIIITNSSYQNKFDSLCSIASLYNHIEENRKSIGFDSINLNIDNQILVTYNEVKERTNNFPLIQELYLPLGHSNSKKQKLIEDNQVFESIKIIEEHNEINECSNILSDTSDCSSNTDISQYIEDNEVIEYNHIPTDTSTCSSNTDTFQCSDENNEIIVFDYIPTNTFECSSNRDISQCMEEDKIIELNSTQTDMYLYSSNSQCIEVSNQTPTYENIPRVTSECSSNMDYSGCTEANDEIIEFQNVTMDASECVLETCTENNVPKEISIKNELQVFKSFNTAPVEETEKQNMYVDFSEFKEVSSSIQILDIMKLPINEHENEVKIETNVINENVNTTNTNISEKLKSDVSKIITSLNNLSPDLCDEKCLNRNNINESQNQYSKEIKLICIDTQNTSAIIKNDEKLIKNCVNNVCTLGNTAQTNQDSNKLNSIVNRKIVEDNIDRKKDINTNSYKVSPNNVLLSTKVLSTFKERKRKCSESEDEDESLESEFEPIEDSCFDEQTLRFYENCKIKIEETDYNKKTVMTDIVNEDDDCIIIKYWPTKYF